MPSAWEHLEMALGEGSDRISSLALEPGGTFRAVVREHQRDEDDGCAEAAIIVASAVGSWRQCRGGVELVFSETPELDLPELSVSYALRRGSLVAEASELPDGLAQEYSSCPTPTLANSSSLGAERLSLIDRMLADAATADGGTAEATSSPCRSVAALGDVATRLQQQDSDSGSDRLVEGMAPVGIIEDNSDSDDAESIGGSTPRCQVRGVLCASPDEAKKDPLDACNHERGEHRLKASCDKPPQCATSGCEQEEEYIDDFEGESDDGSNHEA